MLDPLQARLVTKLSRPVATLTGITSMPDRELGKRCRS